MKVTKKQYDKAGKDLFELQPKILNAQEAIVLWKKGIEDQGEKLETHDLIAVEQDDKTGEISCTTKKKETSSADREDGRDAA